MEDFRYLLFDGPEMKFTPKHIMTEGYESVEPRVVQCSAPYTESYTVNAQLRWQPGRAARAPRKRSRLEK